MTEKKKFEKPSMQVIELQQRTMLLAGSNPAPAPNSASIDDYEEDNTFSWDD